MPVFKKIAYADLNARQQENYNFHQVAARLAEYGFNSLRLTDDWEGADFIACHIDGEQFLKVQLKGRMQIDRKYEGKDIHIAFRFKDSIYLYPHDELVKVSKEHAKAIGSLSWIEHGAYSWPSIPQWARVFLARYAIH